MIDAAAIAALVASLRRSPAARRRNSARGTRRRGTATCCPGTSRLTRTRAFTQCREIGAVKPTGVDPSTQRETTETFLNTQHERIQRLARCRVCCLESFNNASARTSRRRVRGDRRAPRRPRAGPRVSPRPPRPLRRRSARQPAIELHADGGRSSVLPGASPVAPFLEELEVPIRFGGQ